MKKADIVIGQAYYVEGSNNWAHPLSATRSYALTAERLTPTHKMTAVDFYSNNWHGNGVLMTDAWGRTKYIPYGQVRAPWAQGVKVVTEAYRDKYDMNRKRAQKYQEHLNRKHKRETVEPIRNAFIQAIKDATGSSWVYQGTTLGGFSVKEMQNLINALNQSQTKAVA